MTKVCSKKTLTQIGFEENDEIWRKFSAFKDKILDEK